MTWAGVLPDADGLGVIPDVVGSWISGKECTFYYYQTYHHLLLHVTGFTFLIQSMS